MLTAKYEQSSFTLSEASDEEGAYYVVKFVSLEIAQTKMKALQGVLRGEKGEKHEMCIAHYTKRSETGRRKNILSLAFEEKQRIYKVSLRQKSPPFFSWTS